MTVYESNPRTGTNFFSKKRKIYKAFKHYGKHEPGLNTTHKLQGKDWSRVTEITYSSLGSPAESPVLLYRNKHLINEGLGLPTYS